MKNFNLTTLTNHLVSFFLLTGLVFALNNQAKAQCSSGTFLDSTSVEPLTTDGGTIPLSLSNVPTASGGGTLTFYVRGDINSSTEVYDFYDENGNLLGTSPTGTQCGGYVSLTISVTQADLNNWGADGTMDFTADARSGVNTFCTDEDAFATLTYPFAVCPTDAGIFSVDSPLTSCSLTDSEKVSITIANYGFDTIYTIDVSYQVNNNTVVTETVNDTILPYDTTANTPSFYTYDFTTPADFSGVGPYFVDSWTSLAGDTLNNNDTLEDFSPKPLQGTFTLGGNNPDFNNFTEAVNLLEQVGICDSVTINVVDTTINEQLDIGVIPGTSDSSMVTFQSASGDSTAVVMFYNGTSTSDNFVVKFNNNSHVRFHQMTLANSGATYSTVVTYQGTPSNTYITNSVLQGDLSTVTTSTNKSVVYYDGMNPSNNVLRNNVIKGGSYGTYLYGDFSNPIQSMVIDGNHFIDQYYRGGHFYYHNNLKVINNTFESTSTYSGMTRYYFYYCEPSLTIRNNTLKGRQTGYGFQIWYSDLTSPGYIANNTIHIGDTGTTSTSYGIYAYSSENLRIIHNSFNIESDGSSSRALYISSTSPDVYVMNNNIYNSGPGYGVYYNYNIPVSDYNNIFAPNGNVGYSGGTHTTLNDWQSATMYDSNSVSVDPMYMSGDDLHTCQYALDGAASYVSNVKRDIDGETRDNPGPDIGADEFLAPASFTLGPDVDKCPSESATIGIPNANADFMWSNGDTTSTTNVANPGTYSVMAITACDTLYDTIQVNDLEEPTAAFKTDQSSKTVYLENRSTYADSFFWYMGDGYTSDKENPFLHIYDSVGTYTIMLIANGECGMDTTTQTITIEPPDTGTGINEVRSMQMQLYPNPTNDGQFTLVVPNTDKLGHQATLSIMDITGKAIYTEAIELNNQNHYKINNATLESGVYYVRLTGQKASVVRKLVVN